jgi:MtN3 and saliva related transmembrane protein
MQCFFPKQGRGKNEEPSAGTEGSFSFVRAPQASGGVLHQVAAHLMNWTSAIGLIAAFCTTVSYIPQLKKCWLTGSAGDLSVKTFAVLATGVALWVLYGVLQNDTIIILANAISLSLLFGILYFKLRERWRH